MNNLIQSGLDRDVVRQYTSHSVAGMHAMLSRYHIIRREETLEAARRNEERKLGEREAAAQTPAAAKVIANRSQNSLDNP